MPTLERNKTTHLLLTKPEGEKFLAALRWNLHILKFDWYLDSIAAGYALPEESYSLVPKNRPVNQPKSKNAQTLNDNRRQKRVAPPAAARPADPADDGCVGDATTEPTNDDASNVSVGFHFSGEAAPTDGLQAAADDEDPFAKSPAPDRPTVPKVARVENVVEACGSRLVPRLENLPADQALIRQYVKTPMAIRKTLPTREEVNALLRLANIDHSPQNDITENNSRSSAEPAWKQLECPMLPKTDPRPDEYKIAWRSDGRPAQPAALSTTPAPAPAPLTTSDRNKQPEKQTSERKRHCRDQRT